MRIFLNFLIIQIIVSNSFNDSSNFIPFFKFLFLTHINLYNASYIFLPEKEKWLRKKYMVWNIIFMIFLIITLDFAEKARVFQRGWNNYYSELLVHPVIIVLQYHLVIDSSDRPCNVVPLNISKAICLASSCHQLHTKFPMTQKCDGF